MAEENNIPKVYDPAAVEKKWYAYWVEHGFFHQPVDKSRKPFSVVIPPPNITGKLHMGHALDNTLQDILVRWHRMMGGQVPAGLPRGMTTRDLPRRSKWKRN